MKPKSYRQLYVHIVFAVKYRQALLSDKIRSQVFEYMSGIVSNLGHKSINIDGTTDHVHLLIGLNPVMSISELVRNIKRSSTLYINKEKLCPIRFSWQEGYGVFSSSHSHLERVYNYIINQHQHHQKISFREEYIRFLKHHEIDYDERFLFDFFDSV